MKDIVMKSNDLNNVSYIWVYQKLLLGLFLLEVHISLLSDHLSLKLNKYVVLD